MTKKSWIVLSFSLLLGLGFAFGACSGDGDNTGTDAGIDGGGGEDGGEEDGSSGTDEDVVIEDNMIWQSPQQLDETDETVGSVALAVHSSGDFQAVWDENLDTGEELIMGRRFDGSQWAAPQALTTAAFSSDDPVVGFGAGGRAAMVYIRMTVGFAVWGAASDGQDVWEADLELQPYGGSTPEWTDMGGPVAIWYSTSGAATSIWSVAHIGSNWTTAVEVGTSSIEGDGPRVAANNGGDGMAVWSNGSSVYAATVSNGDQWGAPVFIHEGTEDTGDAEVAVDTDGNAVAVWRWDGDYIDSATYTPTGGWSAEQRISTGGRAAGSEPVVAMDSSGRAMAVWDENDGMNRYIFAARFIPGSGWSSPEALCRQPQDARSPAIGMNSNGKAVVVWKQEVGDTDDIWSARYLPEPGGWTEAEAIYTDADWDATFPKVAVDEAGHAVAVWNANGPNTEFNVMSAVLQ